MSETKSVTHLADEVASVILSASDESVALGVFSGLIANADSFLTKRGIESLVELEVSPPRIHEIVLQSYLFCGFPRMLDALFDLAATISPERYASSETIDYSKLAYSEDEAKLYELRGRELIQLIYGERYDKLERAIIDMSPDAFRLMIMEGYGKTLSRPGLEVQSRELAVVAALAVDKRARQLRAHLFGAKNVGVSYELIAELLRGLSIFIPESNTLLASNLLTEVFSE
jgi:4-carboxymuconolactone decarboxylase